MKKSIKRLRFEKVATRRVQKIMDTLDLLSNCSNTNNYDYDDKDVEHMFSELTKHLRECKNKYALALLTRDSKSNFTFEQ